MSLTEDHDNPERISLTLFCSLPAVWCQLVCPPVLPLRGFPLCHRCLGKGRRESTVVTPQQIMDTQRRLSHERPNWGMAVGFWLLPTLKGRSECCEATSLWWTVRRGIILEAWCSEQWCLLTVHNDELSHLLGPSQTIETRAILWDALRGLLWRDRAVFGVIRWKEPKDTCTFNKLFLPLGLLPHAFVC